MELSQKCIIRNITSTKRKTKKSSKDIDLIYFALLCAFPEETTIELRSEHRGKNERKTIQKGSQRHLQRTGGGQKGKTSQLRGAQTLKWHTTWEAGAQGLVHRVQDLGL